MGFFADMAKLLQAASQPKVGTTTQATSQYSAYVVCKNCGWGLPDGTLANFDTGRPLNKYLCPMCKCNTLKNAVRKVIAEKDEKENATYVELRKALKKLEYKQAEIGELIDRMKREHPDELDPTKLLAIILKGQP